MNKRDLATLKRASEIIRALNARLPAGESKWLWTLAQGLDDVARLEKGERK